VFDNGNLKCLSLDGGGGPRLEEDEDILWESGITVTHVTEQWGKFVNHHVW
jgi:hypothetical protein